MNQGPGSVGDSSFKPIEPPKTGPVGSKDKDDKKNIFNAQVRTLGDVKNVLVKDLGEKKGTELYNKFLASMVEMSLTTVNRAQRQAQQAAKKLRQKQQ